MSKHRFAPNARRKNKNHDARLRNLAIELLCNAFPTGAVALDAHCNVLFSNREGTDLLIRWNSTRSREIIALAPSSPAVPIELVAACDRLRQGEANPGSQRVRPKFGGRVFVRNPRNPNLSAVVALERSTRDRRVAVFCLLLQDRLKDNLVAGRRDQLAMLTIAERRVAKLVADGLRNSDIAKGLGKSITTVKSQLGTIFSKLEIRSRTQLAALLRSA